MRMIMKIDFDRLKSDYVYSMEDDDRIRSIKEKVFSLSEPEIRILLLYTELGSYAGVAKQLNCSAPTVKKYIEIIREKFK